ncbi:MAG: TetR/AcrR family transcriptional regulator [Pseudomonadales bacterium]
MTDRIPMKSSSEPPDGTSGGRQAATRARKESVLAAALACFSEMGIKDTTIHHIQRRAGCSIGSIYHHFGSKEGIAEALFLDAIQRLNQGMLRRIRAAGDAEGGVKAVVEYYCEWTTRHRDMARYLHSRDIDFSAEARARLKQIHKAYIVAVFGWFAPYVARGEMRHLPPETYVPLISGPIQEYVRRWLSGHHAKGPRQVKALFAQAAWGAVKS